MIEICAARGIPHDIAMDDASRIYGDAWYKFLGSSRTMLGSESGSNVFDFDGDLEEEIDGIQGSLSAVRQRTMNSSTFSIRWRRRSMSVRFRRVYLNAQ